MSSQGIMSIKMVDNNPGLCPVMKQKSGLCGQIGAQNRFLSLSLNTTKTVLHYQMLIIHPAFYPYFYGLPRDPQGWHRSYKLLNRTVSCEFGGDFVSLYPSMFRDLIHSHYVLGRDIIQHLLAPLYQWRHCLAA